MIGDGDVFVAERRRSLHHHSEAVAAIAVAGVHVEITTHVLPPHQDRKPSDRGLFHFAGVVPELGDDEVQPRISVDVLFTRAQPGAAVARPHRRHVGRRAGGDVERGTVSVSCGDADVDFRLLIAQQ